MATNKNFVVKNGLEVGGDITVTGSVTSAGQTMPASDGSAGQYLQTDGSGNLSWSTVQSSIDITDGTTTDTLNTGETLTFAAGTAITTTVSDNQVEISVTGDTDDISEGSTNLYYTDARAIAAVEGASHLTIDGGTLYVDTANNYVGIGDTSPAYMLDVGGTTGGGSIAVNGTQVIDSSSEVVTAQLKDSGVTAGSYGSASLVPIITVDAKGRVTAASTTSVAGVSSFTWNSLTETLNIGTADGGSFDADISGMASESYVDTAISNLIGGAPGALDTLNELAAAINDDSSYASTVTSALAGKVSKLGDSITGSLSISSNLTVSGTITGSVTGTASNAALLDNLDSTQFLRSDTDDSTSGRLSVGATSNYSVAKFGVTASSQNEYGLSLTNTYTATSNSFWAMYFVNDTTPLGTFSFPNNSSGTINLRTLNGFNLSAGSVTSGTNLISGTTSELVINDGGNDVDFRVESDTKTHALFVQGSDGNVGIGVSSPSKELDVAGQIWARGNTAGNDDLLLLGAFVDSVNNPFAKISYNDTTADLLETNIQRWGATHRWTRNSQAGGPINMMQVNGSSGADLSLYHQASPSTSTTVTEEVRLSTSGNSWLNGGNVGIGTDSPGNRLQVEHSSTNSAAITLKNTESGSFINLHAYGSSAATGSHFNNRAGLWGWTADTDGIDIVSGANGGGATNDIRFYTNGYSTSNERMRITSAGNVGIGTISPNAKLEVLASSSEGVRLRSYADVGQNYLTFYHNNGNRQGYIGYGASGDNRLLLVQDKNDNIEFYSNGATRMAISSGGNVGIKTTNPDAPLHVVCYEIGTGSNKGLKISNYTETQEYGIRTGVSGSENTSFAIYDETNSANRLVISSAGNIGLRNASPVYNVDIDGDVRFYRNLTSGTMCVFWNAGGNKGSISTDANGTTYNTTSDRRLKDNINTITDGKEKVLAMNPVNHTWIADPDAPAVHGFIAQEMKEIIPEAVSGDENSDEMMSMDYGRITPVIVAALQDALKEIEELKERIKTLENK